ncbi:MAG TPA: hypothetical protein VFT06_01315 [Flavisolibacter sp.]|nr:hypothetical protein [Flavisolibacter sp.]
MHGSFEKKVQEKLEDMSLQPSVPVWEKIELQIRPEEKRRRFVFWLLPAVLLLGCAGWWFFIATKDEIRTDLQAIPFANKRAEKQSPVATKNAGGKTPTLQPPPAEQRLVSHSNSHTAVPLQQSVPTLFSHTNTMKRVIEKEENELTEISSQREKEIPATKKEYTTEPAAILEEKSHVSVTELQKPVDSAAQRKTEESKQESLPVVSDSLKKKVAAVKRKSAHKILLAAGWSRLTSDASGSNLYASPDLSSTPGSYSGGATQTRPVNSGFAFSIGYAREKTLSNKLSLSIGLQYAYYSTHQQIGSFKVRDTALRFQDKAFEVSGFYSAPPGGGAAVLTEYTTRIHVAELPVSVQYSPFSGLPLSFTGGALYGRVLHSNALTYDAAARFYYLNPQNNRRNSVNLFSAVQYRLVHKSKLAISAGPAVQYNLVPLQKEGSRRHLLFAGLKTEIIF